MTGLNMPWRARLRRYRRPAASAAAGRPRRDLEAPASIWRLALASCASATAFGRYDLQHQPRRFAVLAFSTLAFSTITGPVTSMTTRALPGADRPPRKDLTRPTAASPGCGGSCSLTSGSSTKTRLGLVSEKTWKSTCALQADDELGARRVAVERRSSGWRRRSAEARCCAHAGAGSAASASPPTNKCRARQMHAAACQ